MGVLIYWYFVNKEQQLHVYNLSKAKTMQMLGYMQSSKGGTLHIFATAKTVWLFMTQSNPVKRHSTQCGVVPVVFMLQFAQNTLQWFVTN